MTAMVYQDFDLSIEVSSGDPFRYRARVASLATGQASSDFTLPFSAQDLEILFLRLGRPRRGVRAIGSPEMQAAQAFGSQLFATVFTGPVQSALVSTLYPGAPTGTGCAFGCGSLERAGTGRSAVEQTLCKSQSKTAWLPG
ncbi:MAG: hypothetical protein R3E79_41465 [Caldilineaceae bacterium]